jgi:hypothetical protein
MSLTAVLTSPDVGPNLYHPETHSNTAFETLFVTGLCVVFVLIVVAVAAAGKRRQDGRRAADLGREA